MSISRIVEVSHADSVVRARGLVARHHGHEPGSITRRRVPRARLPPTWHHAWGEGRIARVLLTGATGRIGRYILTALNRTGCSVVTMGRRPSDEDHIVGDVLAQADWCLGLDPEVTVVHLAGEAHNTPAAWSTNVGAAEALAAAASEAGCRRVVFASSNCVLGHCDQGEWPSWVPSFVPIDETHLCVPGAPYGNSKMAAEAILGEWGRRHSVPVISLRLGWVWHEAEISMRRNGLWDDAVHAPNLWSYVHIDDVQRVVSAAVAAEDLPPTASLFVNAPDTNADLPTEELVARHYPAARRSAALDGHAALIRSVNLRDILSIEPERSWRR